MPPCRMRAILPALAACALLGCYRSHDRGVDAGPPLPWGPQCCDEAVAPDECLASHAQCRWLVPTGCGPAPDGVVTQPSCVGVSSCHSDAECGFGRRCVQYWIDPCAGATCDACGGTEGHCE